MMRVIDGAKVFDGANNAPDIPVAARSGTTVESTPVDMGDPGHNELIVNAQFGERTGSATVLFSLQESNEAGANFTTITGTSLTISAGNLSRMISINWAHPDRKRYARIRGQTLGNTFVWGATSLRVRPRQEVIGDSNVIVI